MLYYVRLFIVLLLLVTLALPASAVVYVKQDSCTQKPDGRSWATAYHTIQEAANRALPNIDEIWVAAGTYNESLSLRPGVELYGGFGGLEQTRQFRDWKVNPTIIVGSSDRTIDINGYVTNLETTIDGFTIRNKNTGVYYKTWGVFCQYAPLVVKNTRIEDCFYAMEIHSCTAQVSNNVILNCKDAAISCWQTQLSAICNVISKCTSGIRTYNGALLAVNNAVTDCNGPAIHCEQALVAQIINNTLVGNIYGIESYYGYCLAVNNIVAYNQRGIGNNSGQFVLTNNCVYGNGLDNYDGLNPGECDITLDPRIAIQTDGMVHIEPDSPCVDAGDYSVVLPEWHDYDYQYRIQGSTVDIGADESDGTQWPRIVYLNPSGNDSNDGLFWSRAVKSVSRAMEIAQSGDEVWFAAGSYPGFTIKEGVTFRGGYAGFGTTRNKWKYQSTIKGQIIGAGSSTLDGFMVIANGPWAVECRDYQMQVTNNVICNLKDDGGGITGNLDNSLVAGNFVVGCAQGIVASGSATIMNNTLAYNVYALGVGGNALVHSNIIAYNRMGVQAWQGNPHLDYNNLFGNVERNHLNVVLGANDISVDPKFILSTPYDLRIRDDSPCRDAGDNTILGYLTEDIDGESRSDDQMADIGADECYGWQEPIPLRVIYVKPGSSPGNGKSWQTAYAHPSSVMTDINSNGPAEVWVAKGTYSGTIALAPFTQMYGGFEGIETERWERVPLNNPTILKAYSNNYEVVTRGDYSTVDGFVIRGGYHGITTNRAMHINGNIITKNSSGIYAYEFGSTITNNMIFDNTAGVTANKNTFVRLINNTIAANAYGISCYEYSWALLANNIIAYNKNGVFSEQPGCITLANNDVYGSSEYNYRGIIGTGSDISVDPGFMSPELCDFHIRQDSLCRDAGDNSLAPFALDIDGQDRAWDMAVDIGADESYDEYYEASQRILRVDAKCSYSGDGKSWNRPYRTFKDVMLDVATNGPAEIWVKRGTYPDTVTLPSFTHLYGGFNGTETSRGQRNWAMNETVIQGGVRVENAYLSTIDGFSVKNCYFAIDCYYSKVYIANNKIQGNSYGITAGGSDCTIVNNLISDNKAVGISGKMKTPTLILNNTITNNEIGINFAQGIQPTVANNIIAFNETGISFIDSLVEPYLSHNNVYGNRHHNYLAASPDFSHETDISLDPLFASPANWDYRMLPGSPCIDAGSEEDTPEFDLDCCPRPKDGNGDGIAGVDIGCYEAPGNYVTMTGAKGLPDGSSVGISDLVTTALFSDRFYAENPNRICGIGVLGNVTSAGRIVTVEGTMKTVNGERVIASSSVMEIGAATVPLPWYLNFNALGGGPLGLQAGVKDWRMVKNLETNQWGRKLITYGGANNIGLLVKTTGQVTFIGGFFFYVDGSCPFDDGDQSVRGVYVDWPFTQPIPAKGSFVEITAISSCTMKDGEVVRMLRPVSAESVRVLQ